MARDQVRTPPAPVDAIIATQEQEEDQSPEADFEARLADLDPSIQEDRMKIALLSNEKGLEREMRNKYGLAK
jgi:hypothetical protein